MIHDIPDKILGIYIGMFDEIQIEFFHNS